tara:strand:+ start:62 stop:205 length:144 start_codon:yes stop_codon:yes gene_type:complete
MSLKETTEIGLILSTAILIPKKADPHIELRIIKRKKLFLNKIENKIS